MGGRGGQSINSNQSQSVGDVSEVSYQNAANGDGNYITDANGSANDKTIAAYTENGYAVNYRIRNGDQSDIDKQFSDNMSKALSNETNFKGQVYRGVIDNNGEVLKKAQQANGGTLKFDEFISTSKNKTTATSFQASNINSVLFVIKSKTGKDISKKSKAPQEEEVVFNKGKSFKVTKIESTKGKYNTHSIIYLTER